METAITFDTGSNDATAKTKANGKRINGQLLRRYRNRSK
jgi:hypothetical protein